MRTFKHMKLALMSLFLLLGIFIFANGGGEKISHEKGSEAYALSQEEKEINVVNNSLIETEDADSKNQIEEKGIRATEKNHIVCIDPGHQEKGNYSKEPVGPGAKESKPKISSGTRGSFTGNPEYKVNLEVSLKLRDALENRGYAVVMTREKNKVDISNKERAEIANSCGADIFLRIHADGSSEKATSGISVLCPSKNCKYTKGIFVQSNELANEIYKSLVGHTGANGRGIMYRNDISGFNWSEVPVALVEMGFMTNHQEDKKLSQNEYQVKLAEGIADGVDAYFENMD